MCSGKTLHSNEMRSNMLKHFRHNKNSIVDGGRDSNHSHNLIHKMPNTVWSVCPYLIYVADAADNVCGENILTCGEISDWMQKLLILVEKWHICVHTCKQGGLMCEIRDCQSAIVKYLNNSPDPKHTLLCRENAFVAIYPDTLWRLQADIWCSRVLGHVRSVIVGICVLQLPNPEWIPNWAIIWAARRVWSHFKGWKSETEVFIQSRERDQYLTPIIRDSSSSSCLTKKSKANTLSNG